MGYVLSAIQWVVPVKVRGTYLADVDGRRVMVDYSAWVFRSRRFGRKREWVYLDG